MLRRTLQCLSSGGDLFPTSKAAANLNPTWLMSRKPAPPPGKGKCYVEVTYPEHHNKFSTYQPEAHTHRVISMSDSAAVQALRARGAAVPDRPPQRATASILAGLNGSICQGVEKKNDSVTARVTISAKEESEKRMRERDYGEHQRAAPEAPGFERIYNFDEANTYIEERSNQLCARRFDQNPSGYTHEYLPWTLPKRPEPDAKTVKK